MGARRRRKDLLGRKAFLECRTLLALLAAAAIAAPACRSGRPPLPQKRRNLVLVLIDTLRRDHLPSYGYPRPTAPFLARLAAQGSIADGVSPTSWTKPAVATVLTGLHPLRHQTFGNLDVLPEEALTLAEMLKAHGYQTLGVTANGFVGSHYGFSQGFDLYFTLPEQGLGRFEPASSVNRIVETRLPPLRPPFFLYVHYLDPHAPYETMSAITALDLLGHLPRATPVGILELEMENFMSRPQQLLDDAQDLYDGEIRRVDDAVSAILERLRTQGLLDTTLVVVTSDHGEEMQEHGRMGHGQSLYDEVVKVPLIFWGPGEIPRGVHHGSVSLEDIVPTSLDLLGLEAGKGHADGEDLAPQIRAGTPIQGRDREMLLHLDCPGGHYLALRTDLEKVVLGQGPYRKQVFDLSKDPREQQDLLPTEAGKDRFRSLSARLVARYRALERRALLPKERPDDEESREALKALGYLGATSERHEHGIPPHIEAPDPEEGGLLGFEDVSSFEACVDTSLPSPQLLSGWYPVDPHDKGGRYMGVLSTTAFKAGAGAPLRARLTGRNPSLGPVLTTILWDGAPLARLELPPGPVDVAAQLPPRKGGAVGILKIEAHPMTRLAPRIGQQGRREVGLLVGRLCVGAEGPR